MPDINVSNQLPPRSSTNTRWTRKWATLGGCGSSPAAIPKDDSVLVNQPLKNDGQHRHSTSLLRKSSTVSRKNEATGAFDETSNLSMKKSCSLMNVLRSKLNSPIVLRRFRSKSRENSKPILDDSQDQPNVEQEEVRRKKSFSLPKSPPKADENNNNEPTTGRRSRKRDPSPIRRFANRIAQMTRHHSSTPSSSKTKDRQSKSPSKSRVLTDPKDETSPPSSPKRDLEKVDHINSCYDEIRSRYYDQHQPTAKVTPSRTSDFPLHRTNGDRPDSFYSSVLNSEQQRNLPLPPDDPLLRARKQANLKLNCMLSGYGLTTPFGNHERIFGDHHLFKFHHYHDVGKRKYDWNFTNTTSSTFASMRARPVSRSIDSFRPIINMNHQVPVVVEKSNTEDNQSIKNEPVQLDVDLHQTDEDASFILSTDNELFIREDGDPIEPVQQYSPRADLLQPLSVQETVSADSISNISDEYLINSNQLAADEQDEEFERNFLRAVDRALGVVNKDENSSTTPPVEDATPQSIDETPQDLVQATERALASLENSVFFTEPPKEEQIDEEPHLSATPEPPTIVVHTDEEEEPHVSNTPEPSITAVHVGDYEEPHLSAKHEPPTIVVHSVDDEEEQLADQEFEQVKETTADESTEDTLYSVLNEIISQIEDEKNGQAFLTKLDEEEKVIKSKADAYNKLLQAEDNRLAEDVRTDINAVIGEVNLLLRGKLKQFRGLCQANVAKSITPTGEPIPLDSDLEGFWDITFPLIDKVKEKFAKLDARKAKQWAYIEEYDPNDINNRPRIIDDRLKQLQPQQNKSSKIPITKSANDDLKKLIQERRKAAASSANQNQDIEIFVGPK